MQVFAAPRPADIVNLSLTPSLMVSRIQRTATRWPRRIRKGSSSIAFAAALILAMDSARRGGSALILVCAHHSLSPPKPGKRPQDLPSVGVAEVERRLHSGDINLISQLLLVSAVAAAYREWAAAN
jgi:hypothetical protein